MKAPSADSGAELLQKYLKRNGETKAAFAFRIGVTPVTVGYYLLDASRERRVRPKQETRLAIEIATDGAVPAAAWETEEERSRIRDVERGEPPRPRAVGGR